MVLRITLILAILSTGFLVEPTTHAQNQEESFKVASTDWAWWRGPNRNGIASPDQSPPTQWTDDTGILWKTPISGRGHSAPTVVGDFVYIATADEAKEIQSVLCLDRTSGKQVWKTDVHKGGFNNEGNKGHLRGTKANSTIACDGERLFINFINNSTIHLTALDLKGNILWQKPVSKYVVHQGYGSSPAVYGPLVISSADNKGGGAIVGFDRKSGEVVWTHKRPVLPNYTSPIILNVMGKDQLLFTGTDLVTSLNPLTGKVNWEVPGATTECVTSVVSDGKSVVTSGGYPDNHISVVKGDGTGETVWRNKTRVYVPSVLVNDGHIYVVTDAGQAQCYKMDTGEMLWEERLRSKFAASPILVGDNIFATSMKGKTFIFKASPKGYQAVAQNEVNAADIQSTPAICGGKIYMRLSQKLEDGKSQEMLYCIGQ